MDGLTILGMILLVAGNYDGSDLMVSVQREIPIAADFEGRAKQEGRIFEFQRHELFIGKERMRLHRSKTVRNRDL